MNRKLFKSIREYKKESILAPVFVILEVLMEVLIPLQMASIIDVGIQKGDLPYIIKMGIILVIMAMLALWFGVKAGTYAARAGAGYAKNLRHDIFYKVQEFSFKNIDHFSTSSLVTRMTTDVTNVQMAYMMSIRLLARAPIMIVLSWIMTLTINPKIALLFLVVIPLLGGSLIFIAKKAHPHFIKVFDEYDVLNNEVQENVNAARVVKAYVREDYEIEKFHKVSRKVYDLFTKAEKIVAWNSPTMQFFVYGVVLCMVGIGGRDIVFGTMETGELTSVIVYAIQIMMSLMMVSFVFVMIMIAEASTDRITEVLDEIPEMQDKDDAVKVVPNGQIDFENVDFSYAGEGGNLSLKNVNIHIKSGQTVGIIGGTGSSKSTFVQLIPRLYDVWIAWERAYFDAEISWPWLVLGNAFARSTASVQWYEYTGTLGGSLWVWGCNLLLFAMMVSLSDGSWFFRFNAKAKAALLSSTLLLFACPFIISRVIYDRYEEKEDPAEVLIVQPNIDPYHKFEAMSQSQQTAVFLDMASEALSYRKADTSCVSPLLVLAPETFTNDIITGDYIRSATFRRFSSFLKDYPGVSILFGASSYTYIESSSAPSHTARQVRDGLWVESHNSALTVDGNGDAEIFHKNKLVVAVEKTPYPALFCRIDDMLGGVMGRCVGQDSISLMHYGGIPFGCAICYESVYGEYYTGYVSRGAEFMTVITNDAWWGDTPGYRQHLSYASLRAIETRRSIARCANTGISAIIDQRGDITASTPWWEQAVLHGKLNMNDRMTFFVRYGDITGRSCTFVSVLLLLALLVRVLNSRMASRQ